MKYKSKRANSVTRSIKRLSGKYEEYTNVSDNAKAIFTEPNVKAIISCQHASVTSDGNTRLEQLTSLPMGIESRDVVNKSLVVSGVWPTDDRTANSFQFSTEIQQIQIPDGANGTTEVSIPASVSLQVGLKVVGSESVQSLGTATVLISGNDQTTELCIPVEAEKKAQKFNLKNFIGKELESSPSFGLTPWTMLKIKLNVVADQYYVNSIRTSSSIDASSIAPAVINRDVDLKSRLQLCATQNEPQAKLMKSKAKTQVQHDSNIKRQVSSLKINGKAQATFLKAKSFIALVAKRAGVYQINAASEHNLPELTVISPSSGVSTSRSLEGATEVILKSSTSPNSDDAAALVGHDINKLTNATSKSFEVSTANDEDSSVTGTTTADSNDADSTECSVVTERSCNKSKINLGTKSSSDKSSCESFADIAINASRVTFEELQGESSSPQSPKRVSPAESRELFEEDVTTQLDQIVRVYSMRVNAEENKGNEDPQTSNEPAKISGEKTINAQVKPEAEPTLFADIILNTFSADTAPPLEAKTVSVLNEIKENPHDASNEIQPVVLVHEDKSETCFDVEVSVDGELTNIESDSQSEMNRIQNKVECQPKTHRENQQKSSHILAGSTPLNPVKSFEQGYITVKHTLSSIGELTVDSALDSITVPPVISRSFRVAKNKRHPQRREANNFLRRVKLCGSKYDLAEVMDDAVVGWKDIIVGDELCDGLDYASDDESATASLNTVDETMATKSNCLVVNNFCRGG